MVHRRAIQSVREPKIGDISLFDLTAKFSRTPASIDAPPPQLSAHTAEILTQMGCSKHDLEDLKAKGVI
jgi:crotonobetainyl-CoA:carnitine CoA-transferase CaiB-like acyl-CoA transferase